MTSNEIHQEILRCQNSMDDLNYEIKKLKSDEDQLELLRGKFVKLQSDFGQRQGERISKLKAAPEFSNLLCGKAYREGMLNLLSGSEFSNAYNALGDDMSKIRCKLLEIDNTIFEKQERIAILEQKLTELQIQYEDALNLESKV